MGVAGPGLVPAGLTRVGAAPARLDLGAPLLVGEAAQLGRARRLRGATRRGRGERCAQDVREAFTRGGAVAALGTSLGGRDREDGSGESLAEHRQGALALTIIQRARRAQIQAQLNPRIRRVDALAAGTRRVGEALPAPLRVR